MHPILIEIPLPLGLQPLTIHSYGFMMMLAFLAGLYLALNRAKRAGIDKQVILDLTLYSIVCGIVGARIAFLLIDYEQDAASDHPLLDLVAIWKGGLTFQGGLLLALGVCVWYLKTQKLPAGKIADIFAPSVALGVGIARVGCYLNGCCWGKICEAGFPLGVNFPPRSGPYLQHLRMYLQGELAPILHSRHHDGLLEMLKDPQLEKAAIEMVPVHPTQLYTTVAMLGLFLLIAGLEKLPRLFDGMLMLIFLLAYSVFRFFIEFWREDTPLRLAVGAFAGLRLGQIIALLTFTAGTAAFVYLWKKARAKVSTV
jgi:phosphatidylglycerol:prolipoprotein diacylglycerol transferase